MPLTKFANPEECVEAIIAKVGPRLVVGTPLGIGKPNPLLNALYRRAARDPAIQLKLVTALSLAKPSPRSELERRFLGPFLERVFGDYPELDYLHALEAGKLPPNVQVSEFYFKSGSMLKVSAAQQHYISSNYTHVARDMLAAGMNVILQAVAHDGGPRYSLSSNPDVTLDILPGLREAEAAGRPVAVAGMVNRKLPYMYGPAELEAAAFDFMVDDEGPGHHLFAVPNTAIDPVSHMIGLYASTLIRDGGTVQVGIGSLGDACVYASRLRHADNARYREAVERLEVTAKFGAEIGASGGLDAFSQGLYAGSEMFGDGLLHLYEAGILKRRVYDHAGLQKLLNAGRLSESVGPDTLATLREAGVIHDPLAAADLGLLKRFGILCDDVQLVDGKLVAADGNRLDPYSRDPAVQRHLADGVLGARLRQGVLVHSAFFLGTQRFYDALHTMPEPERRMFVMEAVSAVNELFSDVELEKLQHRDARFLNICMKMTLLGAAASDGLEDGRVVSGVGGQYNFVAMAHALKQARSILLLKSTRRERGKLVSNLVWNYGHCTIPRHLRDIVVTEYGIADLRGREDHEVAAALLNITDSRFQEGLLAEARRAGKLAADYRIPEAFRTNTPERLREGLRPLQAAGLFPDFPFGHDFTPEELVLGKALKGLQSKSADLAGKLAIGLALLQPPSPGQRPYLERMGLAAPQGFREKLLARLVAAGLRSAGAA